MTLGATIVAQMLEEQQRLGQKIELPFQDVTPFPMGIKVWEPTTNEDEMEVVIPRSTPIPAIFKK